MTDTELLEFIFEYHESQLFCEALWGNLNRDTLTAFIEDEDNKECDYE